MKTINKWINFKANSGNEPRIKKYGYHLVWQYFIYCEERELWDKLYMKTSI